MNNKILLFVVVGVLLLAGVFVLSKNQGTLGPTNQVQPTAEVEDRDDAVEKEDEAIEKEDKDEEEDKEERTVVLLTEAGFEPQSVTVKVGAKVVWTNKTSQTAEVRSAKHPTHLVYPPLNLGNFEPRESVSLVFTEPGSYNYHNHLNPGEVGTVVVE